MTLRSRKSDRRTRLADRESPAVSPHAEREWRASAAAVARAWSRWSAATGQDRAPAFAAYEAALASEERAAAVLERALASR